MHRRQLLTAAVASVLVGPTVWAQGKYPQRPITLVVPTAPGGSTDFTARLLAEPLSRALGQPVIVDNKPGASGNIGNKYVARAAADGYTLLVSYSGYHVGNPHLFKQAGWDPISDFVPVAMLTRAPQVIAARQDLPATNLKELIAFARTNPGKINYALSGSGSIQHIAGESGLYGYELDSWVALYAPAGTPADIVQLLNGEVNKILASPETRRKAEDSGTSVEQMTPQQLGAFTRKELDYWGRVIKNAKITLE